MSFRVRPDPARPRTLSRVSSALQDRPSAPADLTSGTGRTYQVRTYGCQMNVHDSERLSGLLEQAGYAAPAGGEQADVVVFNTCAVRENADNKLYGNLGHLASVKAKHPGMQIAVGGAHVAGRLQEAGQPLGVVHVHLAAVGADLVGPTGCRVGGLGGGAHGADQGS